MSTIEFWTALGAVATLAYCVITAVTLVFLGIQLRATRRDTLGQFVNQLGKEFGELDAEFLPLLSPGSGQIPSNEHAMRCLQFFERVKTLSDIGVLDVGILDAMFGHEFFSLVNEPQLQDNLLFSGDHYFPEVFALHLQLRARRMKLGVDIPRSKSDLALRDGARYEKNLQYFRHKRLPSGKQ
jgi:hypothetical protein